LMDVEQLAPALCASSACAGVLELPILAANTPRVVP